MFGTTEDWLNRFGLLFQFIALYLVTPEIVGRERMNKLFQTLEKPSVKRGILAGFVSLALGVGFPLVGNLSNSGFENFLLLAVFSALFWAGVDGAIDLWRKLARDERRMIGSGALIFTVGFFLLEAATFHPGKA